MGIESDQLVYDYLSRVGDLAQRRQLPSAERMRLVTRLRAEIDEQRAGTTDTPAAVKRILDKLGTPADVVATAGGRPRSDASREPRPAISRPARPASDPGPAVPLPRAEPDTAPLPEPDTAPRTKRNTPPHTEPDTAPEPPGAPAPQPPPATDGPSPPHLAGENELGPRDAAPDWWRVDPGPFGGPGTSVPGFVGGIEVPEILKPPPEDSAPSPAGAAEADVTQRGRVAAGGAERTARSVRVRPASWRGVNRGGRAPLSPVLVAAAILLVVGAVFGSLLALGLGWVIAYGTRKLSRTEAKLATLGLPGLVAAGAVFWLWGRLDGRWGEPLSHGQMGDALLTTWPVALRTAAVVSALFLLWKARRLRQRG